MYFFGLLFNFFDSLVPEYIVDFLQRYSLSPEESSDLHALILFVSKSQAKTRRSVASCRFNILFKLLINFKIYVFENTYSIPTHFIAFSELDQTDLYISCPCV